MSVQLKISDCIPPGFLDVKPHEITEVMEHPSLIHLKGETGPPLFISILLHGNEFSGLLILQKILKKYSDRSLPKSLVIFIGNPAASAQRVRHLSDQPDFNRIWNGHSAYESSITTPLLQYVKDQKIQAAVDIHNNSGRNPIYGCINRKEKEFIQLAQLFSKNIVYFTKPDSVLSMTLSGICPTMVIECGLPGNIPGITTAVKCIETLINKEEKWKESEIQVSHIYHTCATLYIEPDSIISFDSQPVLGNNHFCLSDNLDELNFKKIEPGTILGKVSDPNRIKLINEKGENIFGCFFSIIENQLRVKSSFIPSMFTKNAEIAKSDCLGYVMEKISIDNFFTD